MFPYDIVYCVSKELNDFPVWQNSISNNNPFISPILHLWSTRDFLQWGGPSIDPLATVMMALLWWRRHPFCHVRLGVNFMYWSNFCMLVWLYSSWRDFVTLSDIIRMCGHVMDDVITLWWSRESWYDFIPSLLKISSWCDFVCLDAIDWILIRFSSFWLVF